MITFACRMHIPGLSARRAFDFLLNATDEEFQTWWPGVHLRYRTLKNTPSHVGKIMFVDQFIGDYRVAATEVITEAIPHRRIVRHVVKGIRMPVRIVYELEDDADAQGVTITHSILAGFTGLGRIFDPAFRLYFSRRFIKALDEHLVEEFAILAKMETRLIEVEKDAGR